MRIKSVVTFLDYFVDLVQTKFVNLKTLINCRPVDFVKLAYSPWLSLHFESLEAVISGRKEIQIALEEDGCSLTRDHLK